MKIVFVGSRNWATKLPEVFRVVTQTLNGLNIEILGPASQKYEDLLTPAEIKGKNPTEIHAMFMRKAIDMADAMIVESTFEGFALGHEATVALEQHKPVLVITQKDVDFTFIYDKKFFARKYENLEDIPLIIKDFINIYNKKFRSIRVNILLNQRHENYLDWYNNRRGINKSAIVRQLLDEKIKSDDEYNDFEKRMDF